jgi:hypothetical protein
MLHGPCHASSQESTMPSHSRALRFLIVIGLLVIAGSLHAQILYLEDGVSGSTVALGYTSTDAYRALGAGFGLAHRGTLEFGALINRVDVKDEDLRGTEVSPFVGFSLLKQNLQNSINLDLGFQYSHVWYAGNELTRRDLTMSENSLTFTATLSSRQRGESAVAVPYALVAHTRGSVKLESLGGHIDELNDDVTGFGCGLGILVNDVFYVTPQVYLADEETFVSVTIGYLKIAPRI